MRVPSQLAGRFSGFAVIVLALGLATSIEAGSRQAAPRAGGGGYRAAAPGYHGGATRGAPPSRGGTATRGAPPPGGQPLSRGHANGVARYGYGGYGGYGYGYGYGGYYGYGYPCWGWGIGYGWWGPGWYGGWWGYPWYGYGVYGPGYGDWYGPYNDGYVVTVEPTKPSGPAIIETGVSPSKAAVVLDGETVGFASDYNGRWDTLRVAPGQHTIAFQLKGYRTLLITLDAHPNARYAFGDALVAGEGEDRRTLPAAPAEAPPSIQTSAPIQTPATSPAAIGRLRVHAQPADAAVYLDGEYLGLGSELDRIHGALAVGTGTHRLEAVRPGYVSFSREIEVGATELVSVEMVLEPQH